MLLTKALKLETENLLPMSYLMEKPSLPSDPHTHLRTVNTPNLMLTMPSTETVSKMSRLQLMTQLAFGRKQLIEVQSLSPSPTRSKTMRAK